MALRLTRGAAALLVSDKLLEKLERDDINTKKKRRFKVKGVPEDLQAHIVKA